MYDIVEFKSPVVVYLNELFHKFTRGKLFLLRGRKIFGWDLGIFAPKRGPVTTVGMYQIVSIFHLILSLIWKLEKFTLV